MHEAVQLGGEHGETVAVLAVIQQQAEPGGGIQSVFEGNQMLLEGNQMLLEGNPKAVEKKSECC